MFSKVFNRKKKSQHAEELQEALQRNKIVALTGISSDRSTELALSLYPDFEVENLRSVMTNKLISAEMLSQRDYTKGVIIDNANCIRNDQSFSKFLDKSVARNIPMILVFSSHQSANLYLYKYPDITLVNCHADLAAA
jgi:hypothetical protein